MEKQFKSGDKVRWYRDTIPVPGIVLHATAKRVKIETVGNDGHPIVHYVSPENIDIIPPNDPYSRSEVGKPDQQQRIDPYRARSTLFWQALAGLLCLGVGGGLLSLLTIWANQWELYFSDHSKHEFFLSAFYNAIGLFALTGYITKKQFDEALRPSEVFRASIHVAFWGWVWFMAFYGMMLLLMLLVGGGFLMVVAEIAFSWALFMAFGVIIALIQYFRLKIEKFDQARHYYLLSSEADLAACKAGVLPYQARVRRFWPVMIIALLSLLFVAGGLMITPTAKADGRSFLLSIGIILGLVEVPIVMAFKESLTNITIIEGDISEKEYYSSSKGQTSYHLVCNKQKFRTDAKIWAEISEGSEYRLWYSPTSMIIIASELLKYKPKPVDDRQRQAAIAPVKPNRRQYITEALSRGFQGPVPYTELKKHLYSADRSPLPTDLFYTFQIPTPDGLIHIMSTLAPTELNKASQRILENQAKIDELVQRITSRLSQLPDDKKFAEARAITNKWPILVALGGEIIPLLVAAVHDSDDITTQVLISQLLGDIARDTTTKLSQQALDLLCQHCFVRYAAREANVSWKVDPIRLGTDLTYYGCRACSQSRKFRLYTGAIVAVLDNKMKECFVWADELKVNWLILQAVFDFDRVEIIRASDEEVERFAVQVGNDTDEIRQPRYKQTVCVVSADCGLSPNSVRILERMFGWVSVE